MSLLSLFSMDAMIYPLQKYGSTGDNQYKERFRTTGTAFKCMIQPLDSTDQALTDGQYGQGMKLFCCSAVAIKEGDKITSGGKTYHVKGVQDFNYGMNAHKESILTLVYPLTEAFNSLLLEDDGYRLLETGGYRLLET